MRPLSLSAGFWYTLGKMEMGVACISTYLGRVLLGGFLFLLVSFFLGFWGRKDRRDGLDGFDGWD